MQAKILTEVYSYYKISETQANESIGIIERYLTENNLHLDAFDKALHIVFLDWVINRIILGNVSSCSCSSCDFCGLAPTQKDKVELFINDLLNC